MQTLEDTLSRLAVAFTVRDIMTPNAALVCATSEMGAGDVSDNHSDYDVIPIKKKATIVGYFERKSRKTNAITISNLISDGTSLADLVDILVERRFAFVLRRDKIEGYVHFSDLNHQLVKLTFYVLLESLERLALSSIQSRIDRESLKKDLSDMRFEQIEKAYKKAGRAGRDLVSFLSLKDILRLGAKAGAISVEEHFIRAMGNVRNRAAHGTISFISSYKEVSRLAIVKRECLRVLGTA